MIHFYMRKNLTQVTLFKIFHVDLLNQTILLPLELTDYAQTFTVASEGPNEQIFWGVI